jgi:hypothetical protein
MDQGWIQGGPDLCRQQPRQGARGLCRRDNHRPRIRLTIRQENRVLEQWPKAYVHNGDGILFKRISVTGQQHLILFFHPELPASKTDFGQSTLRSLYGVGAG